MSAPYLTDAEISDITAPLTQGAARIRYFREVVKCRVEARPNGQPLVWRSDFEAVKRGQDAANDTPTGQGPDFKALRDRVASARGHGTKTQKRQPARA